jgi:Zn-dependent M28 family amino/carboxypeptidase
MHRTRLAIVLVLALLVCAGAAGVARGAPAAQPASPDAGASAKLRKAVEPAGILVHERRLQRIADANDGTRASGTSGYDASADYVAGKLRGAGYRVKVQPFTFPFFQELEPTTFSRTDVDPDKVYEDGTDFEIMEYSGSGDVVDAPVTPTNDVVIAPPAEPGSTSGCEASDFPASTAGSVALIQRGTCTFAQKAQNAQAAGAVAAIIFNEGQEGRTDVVAGTLGGPGVTIPVIGTTFAVGEELFNAPGARVSISTSTLSEERQTANVIADTTEGRTDRTVVVGAHLDSVVDGPGINDNGSGSATILEVALQMSKLNITPTNRVRFAFWGAEESGLLGSEHYVESLSEKQLDAIALDLNFDMVASPNYVRFVYDGDGSDTPEAGPAGSGEIERVFNEYFAAQGLETEPTAFDGRSDYGPFIAAGIPAGGLFSGAEGIKTEEQAAIYGGQADVAYDSCYHQACDDITNLNIKGLNELSDGAAHATAVFAKQRTLFVNATQRLRARSFGEIYGEFKGPEARE